MFPPRFDVLHTAAALLGPTLLLAATPAASQPQCAPTPDGGQAEVSDSVGTNGNPDAVVFADGTGLVVWDATNSPGTDDERTAILMRRIDADGVPQGQRIQVNTHIVQDQFEPRVASAPNGRFVVVWRSDDSPGDDDRGSIRARAYGANGNPLGPDFQVNVSTGGDQRDPDVAMADDGRFAIVWYDDAAQIGVDRGREVRMRLYNANGTPRGGEIQLNTITDSTQRAPAVGLAPDGRIVAAWESRESNGTDSNSGSVQARRFNANGQPQGPEFQVNTFTQGLQSEPRVAVDADGSFLIAFESGGSAGNDDSSRSVQARGFLANGIAAGPQVQVNQTIESGQQDIDVAAVGGRAFLIAWNSSAPNDVAANDAPAVVRGITLEGQFQGPELNVRADSSQPGIGANRMGDSLIAVRQVGGDIFVQAATHLCAKGGGGPVGCVENATTLCLSQDRFRVTATWNDGRGGSGLGQVVELTPDTGYFWFFDQANVEMVVKVLNACGFAQRFWVFAGGLTNVRVDLTVVDTQTGEERFYRNPVGTPFQPIQDNDAFATCP